MKKYLKYFRTIRTRGEYRAALAILDRLFDAKPHTVEARVVEIVSVLIEKYEEDQFPIAAPTPIDAIKFRMEQLGWTNRQLAGVLGGRNRVSEVMGKKRELSLHMMRVLHKEMGVPAESLLGG
jgi:HTH-type transcriptional regulator/antitoxin HigA